MHTHGSVRLMLLAVLLATGAPSAAAQERVMQPRFGVGLAASSLGLGVEAMLEGPRVGLRGGYYRFSTDLTREVEGIRYVFGPDLRNWRAALDVFPFGGAFRLSGGLVKADSRAEGTAELTGPITLGARTYQPSEVGAVRADAFHEKDLQPFLGLGFATRGSFGFHLDLGVVFSGRPTVSLTGQTNLTGPERDEFERNVRAEEAEIRRAIADEPLARFYPLVAIGLTLRF